MIIAFSITFIPLYVKVKQLRWYSTLCSFKNDTAEDQLGKTEPHILDAINIFNEIYPDKPLQFDCYVEIKGKKNKLSWNKKIIEINRSIGNKSIPYSSLDTLGLEKNTKSPGYTSHMLFTDESQDVNDIISIFKRIKILMKFKCLPYIMRFIDVYQAPYPYKNIYTTTAGWCNQPSFYTSMTLKEFSIVRGMKATLWKEYLNKKNCYFLICDGGRLTIRI
jgi:hypothetical protein